MIGSYRFSISYQVYLYEGSEGGCDVPWVFSPTRLCTGGPGLPGALRNMHSR